VVEACRFRFSAEEEMVGVLDYCSVGFVAVDKIAGDRDAPGAGLERFELGRTCLPAKDILVQPDNPLLQIVAVIAEVLGRGLPGTRRKTAGRQRLAWASANPPRKTRILEDGLNSPRAHPGRPIVYQLACLLLCGLIEQHEPPQKVPASRPSAQSVRLGTIPSITLAARASITQEQHERIRGLIAQLATIDHPDFGLSGTSTRRAFAPLSDQANPEPLTLSDEQIKPPKAFCQLVEIGPEAIPFLLEALGDSTPTRLTVQPQIALGDMFFWDDLKRNPVNPLERSLPFVDYSELPLQDSAETYTVTIGDVCFVAIGQIVGRAYSAVRYIPSGLIGISSPTHSKKLRDQVRAVWSSENPVRTLFDSLLADYATEGIYNGWSLDGWGDGSRLQVGAAIRLLYYFPDKSVPVIAARLRSFDVRRVTDLDAWGEREVRNGVQTAEFIEAVSWCRAPAIQDALADIAERTDDPEIMQAVGIEAGAGGSASWLLWPAMLATGSLALILLVFGLFESLRRRRGRSAHG
jgi:hypothetical protein